MSSEATRSGVLRRFGRTITDAAAVAGFALAALFLIPGLLGFERYVITGGSMSGSFERGSLVFEREVRVSDLKVGDIITYRPPVESGIHELVTHRIDAIEATQQGPLFRTRGDANAFADNWTFTLESPTQARLDFAVPHAGWILIALADQDLRMIIIGLPAAMVAMTSLLELTRILREPKDRDQQGQQAPSAQVGVPAV